MDEIFSLNYHPMKVGEATNVRMIVLTGLGISLLMLCCSLLSIFSIMTRETSTILSNDKISVTVAPTIAPTTTPKPSSTPELLTVEYQLEVNNVERAVTVQYWLTKGVSGENRITSQLLNNGRPYLITIQVAPGEHVELSGVITNNQAGKLTCRILFDGIVVEQSTRQGSGAGVYCSGLAPKN